MHEGTVWVTRSAARWDAEILPAADDDAEKESNQISGETEIPEPSDKMSLQRLN